MQRRRPWHPCGFGTTTVLSSAILSISLLLLNLVVDVLGQQNGSSSSGRTGFIFQEGGSAIQNINCLGSAQQLRNDILSIASYVPGDYYLLQSDEAGKCFFNESFLKLLDSFSTEFTFTLAPHTSNVTEETIDGITFFIFQDKVSSYNVGESGGYLGLLDDGSYANSSANADSTFAVEFDAFTNPEFNDPPYDHVGVDVHSMNSTITAQAGYYETVPCSNNDTFIAINLTGEGRIQAWIEYNGFTQELSVSISPLLGVKPPKPLLITEVNLSAVFTRADKTGLYVGFTSSTGADEPGWAYVLDWSFNISGSATPLYPNRVVVTKCPDNNNKVNLGLALGVSIPVTLAVILLGVLLGGWYLRRVRQSLHRQFQLLELEKLDYRPKQYSYKELSKATKHFSPEQELGRGGFGVVYKGTLLSATGGSTVVAVKKIIPRNNSAQAQAQDQQEFVSEMKVIGRLRHRNLVQLLGWCHEKKGELMQVYEYMPNGSLDRLLFNRTADDGLIPLSWDQRFHIIRGLAAALVYLHEEWKQLIVHRDVKVSNVMLDSAFNCRLGDFGLARLYEHSQTPDITKVAGTFGYMAPEITNGEFTEKSDVFSFGVVGLEVATGRRSIDFKRPPGEAQLVSWVLTLSEKDRILIAADVGLDGNFKQDELLRVLHVGLLCSQPDPVERPTMRQALQMLNGESPLTPLPSARSNLETPFKLNFGLFDSTNSAGSRSTIPWNEVEDVQSPLLDANQDNQQFENSTAFSGVKDRSLIR